MTVDSRDWLERPDRLERGILLSENRDPVGTAHGTLPGTPRCQARARTCGGRPCQRYPVLGKRRCRLHGGLSTGPRTPEGLARSRRANWKHGRCSREAIDARRRESWESREHAKARLERLDRSEARRLGQQVQRISMELDALLTD